MKFRISQNDGSGQYKLIDSTTASGLFTAARRGLKSASVSSQSVITYDATEYTFSLTLSAVIPQGGLIKIVMSDDVSLT
jgi:hypothetical protein